MKKLIITMISVLLVLSFGISNSIAAAYVSGNVGAVWVNDSDAEDDIGDEAEFTFDSGYGVTAAVGYTFESYYTYRTEIEFGYRDNDFDKIKAFGLSLPIDGDVKTLSLMANGFCDLMPNSQISPFLGGGLGIANVEADLDYPGLGSEDDTVFAYQVAAGVSFAASENVNIDVQYRFMGTADPDFGVIEAEYQTHNAMIGMRFGF